MVRHCSNMLNSNYNLSPLAACVTMTSPQQCVKKAERVKLRCASKSEPQVEPTPDTDLSNEVSSSSQSLINHIIAISPPKFLAGHQSGWAFGLHTEPPYRQLVGTVAAGAGASQNAEHIVGTHTRRIQGAHRASLSALRQIRIECGGTATGAQLQWSCHRSVWRDAGAAGEQVGAAWI